MRCRDAGKRTMTDWHKRTSVNFTALLKPAGRFFEGMSMLHFKSVIMDEPAVMRALKRMSFEVVERNKGCDNVALIGIRRRGVPLAQIMADNIHKAEGVALPTGEMDITCYRDDVAKETKADPVLQAASMDFDVTGKHIVLVDDVLYTGRTVRAAMDALIALGRPASIQLAILCDRGHRELPIRADYVGKNIPTSHSEKVVVHIPPFDDELRVELHEER